MKYRGRDEILIRILETVMLGASMTKIMFYVSISSDQAKEYLQFLQEEMMIVERKRRFYKITEKGIKFLHLHKQMNDLLSCKKTNHAQITLIENSYQ